MIILDPERLDRIEFADLHALSNARECVMAIGSGRISRSGAAAFLMSDFAAIENGATLVIDSSSAWAGVVWRIGDGALRLIRATSGGGPPAVVATDALFLGLADELFHGQWRQWLHRWLADRSTAALDSAALLTGRRGGDALERAEFARLFAIGEPQEGMEAFLSRRRPRFRPQ